ncbi:MAG TPA: hypothetical protein VN381_08970 [Anaerovoracaceae bacterium]|nr:hypothetical protein [Anaerovoracaceae bacterium]
MKKAKILCVCGSGVVSSSMIAAKLKEKLKERGYDVDTYETSPPSVETALSTGTFDIIACISPVIGEFGVPKVNAVGMLTGISEDQVIEDCIKILEAK